MRLVVMGNSGCGKNWLAERIGAARHGQSGSGSPSGLGRSVLDLHDLVLAGGPIEGRKACLRTWAEASVFTLEQM
ncbi:MAG: hypothetical protein RLO50_20550 [Azospirillaceae bacterium]